VPSHEDISVRVGRLVKFKGKLAAAGERAAVQITRSAVAPDEEYAP
jgi:hypothetical protein